MRWIKLSESKIVYTIRTGDPLAIEELIPLKIVSLQGMEKRVNKMLENLNMLHELGRRRCFELGNPFYYQDAADRMEPGNEKR
jgi:hypothetical protein